MIEIGDQLRIPATEFTWKFARAGGPGGQNVNKVASKAILFWGLAESPSVPEEVKVRLRALFRRAITTEGTLYITSQTHRDQERNRQECVDKLRAMLIEALKRPRVRKKTKPTRGSKLRRLEAKKHRAAVKRDRRGATGE